MLSPAADLRLSVPKPSRRRDGKRRSRRADALRPWVERLDDRTLLAAPVILGELQFRIINDTDWTVNGGVYSTTSEVAIGLSAGSWQPVLAVENGLQIDTSLVNPSFTITATPSAINSLDYFPNSLTKLAKLWEFQGNYSIKGADLANFVASTGETPTPVVIAGAAVLPLADDDALKIGNMTSTKTSTTLVPNSIYINQKTDQFQTPQLNLNGRLSLTILSSALAKLADHLHVSFGDDGTYAVTADALGEVNLGSKTGSGVWLSVSPDGMGGSIGSVNVQWKFLQFSWDQTNKQLSLAGQLEVSLKDDSADQTPYLVSLGDTTNAGLEVNFSTDTLVRLQASFLSGTDATGYRGTLGPAGTAINVQGLFFLYDATQDLIGIGGSASMGFGAKGQDGKYENTLTVVIGNAAASEAGLFIKDGVVEKFSGRFVEKSLTIGDFPISGSISVAYTAATANTSSIVNITGTLAVAFAGISAGIVFPPSRNGQGLVIKDGDWDLAGGIGFDINGSAGVKDLQFQFDNLSVVYSRPANASGGVDQLWTLSGGATLNSFFKASVDLATPGLIIRNGDWDFEGIKVQIQNLTAGGFGIQNLLFDYQKTNDGKDWEVKGVGSILLGFIQVGFLVDFEDGKLNSIGVDFKAESDDPGLPVADTGLFITEIGFEVDNLEDLSNWMIEGTVAVAFGEGIQFEGNTVRLFAAEGQFKADSQEFDILKADFQLMDGFLAKGSGTLNLNWVKKQYHIQIDVSGFDGLIDLEAQFNLNQFGQVTVFADVGIRIPNGVPFIGGDKLADLEGLLYIDPIEETNDLVAAWIDVNLLVYDLRLGGEFRFYPAPGQDRFRILWGSDVTALEQMTNPQYENGYHTVFTPTLSASGGVTPNQALFTFEWDNPNAVGDVTVTIPGVANPVTITGGSTTPVSFTYNNLPYTLKPIAELTKAQRYSFLVSPDASGNSAYALNPLPLGAYKLDFVTAEQGNGKLTYAVAYAPPVLTSVAVQQPENSNVVNVQVGYVTPDPATSRIDLYYTTDPTGTTSGTFIKSIPLTSSNPTTGSVSTTWDITPLTWKQTYYVFAKISDTNTNLSGQKVNRVSKAVEAADGVIPYADLILQLNISPNVAVDRAASTLSGWLVTWQQYGPDGKTVIRTINDYTDAFGQIGITAGAGTNWTATVAPKNWSGFLPLPDAARNQTANANGQLFTTNLAGGTYAAPNQVAIDFQNEVSISGQASLDLTGAKLKEIGGAGLSGEVVYVDLNNNNQWDSGEPRTSTDLGGNYDLRFPLPNVAATWTIRLTPDPKSIASYVRNNPDSTTDFSFVAGGSYTVSVDPNNPNLMDAFDHRDFLLQRQFFLSGVAYVSGPNGEEKGPGSTPVANATINLFDSQGNKISSTTSGADGSYQFAVTAPGPYSISAEGASAVNLPVRNPLGIDTSNVNVSIPFVTFAGQPLRQMLYNNASVSGDFYGDGFTSYAMLAISPEPDSYDHSNLFLSIVRGAGSLGAVKQEAYLLIGDVQIGNLTIPSLFWSEALGKFVLPFPILYPGTDFAMTFDPVTQAVGHVPTPAGVNESWQFMGFSTDPVTKTDTWLMADYNDTITNGEDWKLFQFTDYATPPKLVADFNFYTSTGVKPAQTSPGRFIAFAQGDIDGDGLADYMFDAYDSASRQVVAYLLSREMSGGMITQVHTLPIGDYVVNQNQGSAVDINSMQLVKVDDSSTPWLMIHRSGNLGGGYADDVVVFSTAPSTLAQVAKGAATATFRYESAYDLAALWQGNGNIGEVDFVADMNGDGLEDLAVIGTRDNGSGNGLLAGVILNLGGGKFQVAPVISIPDNGGFSGSAGLLSAGSPVASSVKLPGVIAVELNSGKTLLGTNASTVSNSYIAQVNSPGSYGGYDFGFASGTAPAGQTISGVAYIDVNANGRQDPGEPNLDGQRIRVVYTPTGGSPVTSSVLTDTAGRYSLTGAGLVELRTAGMFPRNTQTPTTPPPFPPQWTAPGTVAGPPGGQGVAPGGSKLVESLDFADSFTLGVGTRAGLQPNGQPTGAQLTVEYVGPVSPSEAWSALGPITDDTSITPPTGLTYPGNNNAGSETGFAQAADGAPFWLAYGLRDRYVLQADAVQTSGKVILTSGLAGPGQGSLSVYFFADDGNSATPDLQLYNSVAGVSTVWDSFDGNLPGPLDPPSFPVQTGATLGKWNNYAVSFDRTRGTLSFYVNQALLTSIDLDTFADGAYAGFSNEYLYVEADGAAQTWFDNVQVGAPYVGYQVNVGQANQAGFDLGVKSATTNTGSLQGTVVQDFGTNFFSPASPPIAGIVVYVDMNGNGELDSNDPHTTSDVNGNYRFAGLRPGTYLVRQILKPNMFADATMSSDGQINTTNPDAPITVVVLGGQTTYSNNFSDYIRPSGLSLDFNRDSVPDYVRLVSRGPDATEVQLDIMSGGYVGRVQVVGTFNPKEWRPVGVGDLDGDGQPDLLFQHQTDGRLLAWSMVGGQLRSESILPTRADGVIVAALADLDGNRTTDLIVHDPATESIDVWLLDRGEFRESRRLGSIPRGWVVEKAGDFDADGQEDILIRSSATGEQVLWKLDGTAVRESHAFETIDPHYHLIGAEPQASSRSGAGRLFWQDDRTGRIERWNYNLSAGLLSATIPVTLGRIAREGTYLVNQYDVPAPPPPPVVQPVVIYVQSLYDDILGRPADAPGLQAWVQVLNAGGSPADVVGAIWRSPEHASLQVDEIYRTYLDRAPNADELATWQAAFARGRGEANLAVSLMSSREYRRAHRGIAAYVDAVFTDILGRQPRPAGLQRWARFLRGGGSPARMVEQIWRSVEHRNDQVDDLYQTYLRRQPDPASRAAWSFGLGKRVNEADLAIALLSSTEYLAARGYVPPVPLVEAEAPSVTIPTRARAKAAWNRPWMATPAGR